MKHRLKGLLALVLSLTMLLGMVTVSYGAATDYKITENTVTHVDSVLNGVATVSGTDGNVTITLDSDINGRIHFYNNNGNFVLDLAGHTIDASGAYESLCLDNNFNGSVAIIGSGTLKTGSNNIIYKGSSATLKFDVSGGYDYFTLKRDGADVFTNEKNTTATSLNETYFKGTALVLTQGSATTYPVSIGGVSFNEFNLTIDSDDITGVTGTATYDPADGNNPATLTLNRFVLEYYNYSAINATGDLTINLKGTNTVSTTTEGSYSGGDAIVVDGDLTIKGENGGSLNASSDVHDSISAHNITIDKADLTIGCLYGLNADHGAGIVTISNGSKLTINATTGAINCSTLNFGGNWYQWSKDNANFTDSNTSELTDVIAKDTATLYIKPITYTVKFDANGGSGTIADATGVSGNYTLPANGFNAPVGDEFFGWSVDPAGAERKLPGETMQITRDTTVYAIWKYATLGNQGGGYPGTPQPPAYYPVYIPTVEDEPEVTAPNTFDGGIASAVVVTILSATGGAWLAKKKD